MPIIFTVRDQVFNVAVYGLKPQTVHNCYFERNKVNSNQIKPRNGQLGDPILTDGNGTAFFDFYYKSGLGDQATDVNAAQQQAANLAGVKELIVTDSTAASLAIGYEDTASSVFVARITISVYIPPESEWKPPIQPWTINYSGGDWGGGVF